MTQYADDALLVQRSQQGDRAAFNDLIHKYQRRAYQYAMRLTHNETDASDIVADAFVRVYGGLKNFKGSSAFTTWLYRILTNCYLDLRKRDKSKSTVSLDEAMTGPEGEVERQVADPAEGPEEIAERSAREEAIQTAVAALPEYQQAMLIMYHVEMLSYEEIAEALDLPIGTVKSRLNRARLSLREKLSQSVELFQLD